MVKSSRTSMQREKRMFRKLVLLVITMFSLFSTGVFAVGLGEIKQASGLNQPLSAEIPLLSAGDLAEYEVLASLASSKEFEKVGVERIFFLNSVKFETVRDENNQIAIKVTTRTPVKEPFLNFVVELNWPNGRILREYTLLLDPPIFEENTSSTIEKTTTSSAPNERAPNQQTNAESTTPRSAYVASENSTTQFSGNSYGAVNSNDTLWSIASKVRPSDSVSIHQTLVAIYRANPDAFANGNINNLLKGKVLNIPDENTIQNVPQRAALQDVVMQNKQWRSGGARKIANRSGAGSSSTTSQSSGSRLSLGTADSSGDAKGYGADAAELNEVKNELTRSQEESATLQAENEALRTRLAELLSKAESTSDEAAVSIDDAELAALGQTASEDSASEDTESEVTQNELTDEKLALPEDEAITETTQDENELQNESTEDSINTSTDENAVEEEVTQAPPAIFKPKAKEKGILDQILDGGTLLYAGIGLLIIIVMVVFWRMKKRMEDDEFQDDLVASAGAGSMDTTETFELPDVGDDMLVELDMDDEDQVGGENTDESFDPIGEADIYIAYGKHEQAESLLLESIDDNPIRSDLKVKLMECYTESDNREKFESLAEEVSEAVDSEEWHEQINALRAQTWGDSEASSDEDDFDLPSTEDIFGGDEDELDIDFEEDSADQLDSETEQVDSDKDDLSLDDIDDLDDIESFDVLEADELDEEIDFDAAESAIDGLDDDELSLDANESDDNDDDFSFDSEESDELSLDDDFDFEDEDSDMDFEETMGDEGDEISTKLDLARAYVDMGDSEGAKEILKEVIAEGTEEQKNEAQALIDKAN